ncbi:MAG TPA: SAM-dependent methyltransferase [Pyrinomonadaceae bacterium]|nr:SAM-dependent methyltransferase [Pyrinomonadaceae bacterium]
MSQKGQEPDALPLAERLRERIRREGAISFRDWMAAALYDEREGYYLRPDLKRWGRAGDYRTSPERSRLFAATFARYFARLHEELGSPREWTIFEAGAGGGHFAHGVLQTLKRDYPQTFQATSYVIDEVSVDARERTRLLLEEFAARVSFVPPGENGTPAGEGIVFANELFDAFPVHRVTMRDGVLRELFVGLDDESGFAWAERDPSNPELAEYLGRAGVELFEGQIAEINLEVGKWLERAFSLFERGYLVIVDYGAGAADLYGAPHRRAGTLRAFHRHRLTDEVLAHPGEQDLTTTIDWSNVERVCAELGFRAVAFERQDKFLLEAGLLEQLERMAQEAGNETEALILRSSVRELILPGGMSESFQVLVQSKGRG